MRDPFPSGRPASGTRRTRGPRSFATIVALVSALGSVSAVGLLAYVEYASERSVIEARSAREAAYAARHAGMVALAPSLGIDDLTFARNQPLATQFQSRFAPTEEPHDFDPEAETTPQPARPLPPSRPQTASSQAVPLPMPRPADLGQPADPSRQTTKQARAVAAPAVPEDDRSFIEKLFGMRSGSGPLLAFASLSADPPKDGPTTRTSPSLELAAPPTAVYDITARVVYMPNGEKLEAHSGLGDKLDDPNYVHVRMKGATPPGIYDLKEREALFHGVRAIRMNPVGGSAAVHGRSGLLTHNYLLGPNGDSNGCISFRDYDRFLQAYLKGDVKRIIVVARGGDDVLQNIASAKSGQRRVSSLGTRGM